MAIVMFVQLSFFTNYCVTDGGEVVSLHKGWRVLSNSLNRKGYPTVCLHQNDKQFVKTVHQLVALAFLGPRPDGRQINHKNGNKLDNRPENLEYTTLQENVAHAWSNGLCENIRNSAARRRGIRHPMARMTENQAKAILALKSLGRSQESVAAEFGISREHVRDIWNGRRWKHLQLEVTL